MERGVCLSRCPQEEGWLVVGAEAPAVGARARWPPRRGSVCPD